jgi:hypothetical protein
MVIYNTQLVYLDEDNSTETNTFEYQINNSVPIQPPYIRRDKRSPFPGRPPGSADPDTGSIFTQDFNYSYTGLFSEGSLVTCVCLHPQVINRVSTSWVSATPQIYITHGFEVL